MATKYKVYCNGYRVKDVNGYKLKEITINGTTYQVSNSETVTATATGSVSLSENGEILPIAIDSGAQVAATMSNGTCEISLPTDAEIVTLEASVSSATALPITLSASGKASVESYTFLAGTLTATVSGSVTISNSTEKTVTCSSASETVTITVTYTYEEEA